MKNALLMTGLSVAILAGGLTQAVAEGKHRHGMHHSFEDLDADGDGQITKAEMEGHMQARFEGADTDGSGALSKDELIARMTERQAERIARYAGHMIERHDANGDGELTMAEMRARHDGDRFARMDENGDGSISRDEFDAMHEKHGRKGHKKHSHDE